MLCDDASCAGVEIDGPPSQRRDLATTETAEDAEQHRHEHAGRRAASIRSTVASASSTFIFLRSTLGGFTASAGLRASSCQHGLLERLAQHAVHVRDGTGR